MWNNGTIIVYLLLQTLYSVKHMLNLYKAKSVILLNLQSQFTVKHTEFVKHVYVYVFMCISTSDQRLIQASLKISAE